MAKATDTVEIGTGEVFKDLGLEDAQERRLRTQLVMRVNDLLAARKLSQSAAARILDIAQPHVSELHNYKLRRFSSGRLLHFITRLDQNVEIIIRPKASTCPDGTVSVLMAV